MCDVQLELNGIDLTWADWHGKKQFLQDLLPSQDASAMFESYHALSGQQDRIWKLLQKYRVEANCDEKSFQVNKSKVSVNDSMLAATHVSRDTCENVCNFEETAKERRAALFPDDGFYRTLAHRLKSYFAEQARKSGIDARSALKATNWWTIKVSLYIALWLSVLISGICVRWASWKLSAPMLVMLGFLQGTFHIACGFCVMHDASHYAISTKPWLNELFSRMTNATLSWFHHIWARHHVSLAFLSRRCGVGHKLAGPALIYWWFTAILLYLMFSVFAGSNLIVQVCTSFIHRRYPQRPRHKIWSANLS